MCLTVKKVFNPPIPVMTCWKILVGSKRSTEYYTPYQTICLNSKIENTLVAKGKTGRILPYYTGQDIGRGYIHSFKTRKAARDYLKRNGRSRYYNKIFKCEAHNVHAIGVEDDIISDSITIFWNKKG